MKWSVAALIMSALCVSGLRPAFAQDQNAPNAYGSETSLPPIDSNNQPSDQARDTAQAPNTQMPQFETSTEDATNAGLVPTLGNSVNDGEATSTTANGIVPTLPGLTSYGAQAASAAGKQSKFLSVNAAQSVAYSDNPGLLAPGQFGLNSQLLASRNLPDFYETTSGGILLSKQLGLQNLFASANFSVLNYAHDTNLNTTRYNLSIGDNYVVADLCTGAIVANQSQAAVPLELAVGSVSPQNSQNSSIEVNSRCKATGHLYTTTDFRATKISFTNSTGSTGLTQASSLNDSLQIYGSGGLEYLVPSFVTMGLISSIQETEFINRGMVGLGLANQTSQISFSGYVNKPVSQRLTVSLSLGITDLATGTPTFEGSIEPIYSATAAYTYSPKTSFTFSYNHLVGSPQSIAANFQQIESLSAGVNYRFSPKISLSASVSRSSTTSPDQSGVAEVASLSAAVNSKSLTEQVTAQYKLTQDAIASLNYQHVNRSFETTGEALANVVSFSVNYRR